ncbi:hypothetical protein Tco_1338727 [Tanacetum coccineum]
MSLPLQELMNSQFLSRNAYLLGRAIFLWIFKRSRRILFFSSQWQNTNFFRAFTTSADVPSIYIQQLWNTLGKDDKTGVYSFQLDEPLFNLNADLLRNALEITPKDIAHPFVPPLAGDLIIDFVKGLGYSGDLQYVSTMHGVDTTFKEGSPVHITADDYLLGNLKFVSKGGVDEKKKALEAGKSKQPAPAKQPKPVKKKTSKPTPSSKIRKGKRSDHLVDEKDEESQPTTEPQVEDDEYNLQRGIQMGLESFQAPVSRVAIHLQNPKKKSTTDQYIFQRQSASTNDADNVADMELSTSKADTEILNVYEEHDEEVSNTVALEERTVELDEGQAGSDPDPDLATRVSALEKRSVDFDQKHQLQDKTARALASRVIKEAVYNALQAPLRERFRDLSEFQMKEILYDQMFESGSYRSHPDHTTLYKALKVSMQRDNNAELHEALATSRKRRRYDQDTPPPPPKDSERSKK